MTTNDAAIVGSSCRISTSTGTAGAGEKVARHTWEGTNTDYTLALAIYNIYIGLRSYVCMWHNYFSGALFFITQLILRDTPTPLSHLVVPTLLLFVFLLIMMTLLKALRDFL